eukprot:scaffold1210_cov111-Isochrysis_galbana.AAC.2
MRRARPAAPRPRSAPVPRPRRSRWSEALLAQPPARPPAGWGRLPRGGRASRPRAASAQPPCGIVHVGHATQPQGHPRHCRRALPLAGGRRHAGRRERARLEDEHVVPGGVVSRVEGREVALVVCAHASLEGRVRRAAHLTRRGGPGVAGAGDGGLGGGTWARWTRGGGD